MDDVAAGTPGPSRARRVLVVGGDGEIGRVICEDLAAQGADVAVASLDGNAATELALKLSDGQNQTTGHQIDITDQDAIDGLAQTISSRWGGIDVLVNCAGILKVSPAQQFSAADWRQVIDTNLTGAFFVSQAVARVMIKNGDGGRIVHLSSVRGTVGLAIGGFAAYGASKAGLHLLVRQLAAEWGRHQIRVNAVAAGFVRTALSERALADEGFKDMVAARTPLGRVGSIEEVANAVVFLASSQADFITGQVIYVDGGLTASQ